MWPIFYIYIDVAYILYINIDVAYEYQEKNLCLTVGLYVSDH